MGIFEPAPRRQHGRSGRTAHDLRRLVDGAEPEFIAVNDAQAVLVRSASGAPFSCQGAGAVLGDSLGGCKAPYLPPPKYDGQVRHNCSCQCGRRCVGVFTDDDSEALASRCRQQKTCWDW